LGSAADSAQQRVVAHRQHQATAEGGPGPACERQPEVVEDGVEPRRAPRARGHELTCEPFREDPPSALWHLAAQPAYFNSQPNATTSARQIPDAPDVAAVNPPGFGPQSGQAAVRAAGLVVTTRASSSSVMLSATKPPGIRDEMSTFARIARLSTKLGEIARERHQN